jgi:toxin ParE1/3/4
VAAVRFSRSAKTDLLSIGAYTLQTWGAAQAERYIDSLEHCAKLLAGNPSLGRRCEWIRTGLHRFEKGRHVFFYRREGNGILISRILHQSMLPDRQYFADAEPDV